MVTRAQRNQIKIAMFGINYGIGARIMPKRNDEPKIEAEITIDDVLNTEDATTENTMHGDYDNDPNEHDNVPEDQDNMTPSDQDDSDDEGPTQQPLPLFMDLSVEGEGFQLIPDGTDVTIAVTKAEAGRSSKQNVQVAITTQVQRILTPGVDSKFLKRTIRHWCTFTPNTIDMIRAVYRAFGVPFGSKATNEAEFYQERVNDAKEFGGAIANATVRIKDRTDASGNLVRNDQGKIIQDNVLTNFKPYESVVTPSTHDEHGNNIEDDDLPF